MLNSDTGQACAAVLKSKSGPSVTAKSVKEINKDEKQSVKD